MKLNEISEIISHALRLAPWEYELELDEEGWVNVSELLDSLSKLSNEWKGLSIKDPEDIIVKSDKKRYEIFNGKIRALYGHSIPKKLLKVFAEPPEILYHATAPEIVPIIFDTGLKPMGWQYVHLSADIETAEQVGKRKSVQPKILVIKAKFAFNLGESFYIGNEKVWLADFIDPKFIETCYRY